MSSLATHRTKTRGSAHFFACFSFADLRYYPLFPALLDVLHHIARMLLWKMKVHHVCPKHGGGAQHHHLRGQGGGPQHLGRRRRRGGERWAGITSIGSVLSAQTPERAPRHVDRFEGGEFFSVFKCVLGNVFVYLRVVWDFLVYARAFWSETRSNRCFFR